MLIHYQSLIYRENPKPAGNHTDQWTQTFRSLASQADSSDATHLGDPGLPVAAIDAAASPCF